MNFQYIDQNLINYFDYFQKKSFMFKPKVLIKYNHVNNVKSLNSLLHKS